MVNSDSIVNQVMVKDLTPRAINKSSIANKNYKITNLHKYILWECISNNTNVYGLPIGALSLKDIENDLFKEFSAFFEEVYVIGYGNPWYATHIVVKINSEMMTNPINNIAPYEY